jgi:hypothetical protein
MKTTLFMLCASLSNAKFVFDATLADLQKIEDLTEDTVAIGGIFDPDADTLKADFNNFHDNQSEFNDGKGILS